MGMEIINASGVKLVKKARESLKDAQLTGDLHVQLVAECENKLTGIATQLTKIETELKPEPDATTKANLLKTKADLLDEKQKTKKSLIGIAAAAELVNTTRTSLKNAKLPGGWPVPQDIKKASNALVAACENRLIEIEKQLFDRGIDPETIRDLEDERENTRNLLKDIAAANTTPKRTWEEYLKDNEALCALVKPRAIGWEVGRLLIQAIVVTAVAAAIAVFAFPPLGIILAATVVAAFSAYKIYSTGNAIQKAWEKSNENVASKQLNQGQSIKNKYHEMLKDTVTDAKNAESETSKELKNAGTELQAAEKEVNKLTGELNTLLNDALNPDLREDQKSSLEAKIKSKNEELSTAKNTFTTKETSVTNAKEKHNEASKGLTKAEQAVKNLIPHLSPLAKATERADINPVTGKRDASVDQPSYKRGFGS